MLAEAGKGDLIQRDKIILGWAERLQELTYSLDPAIASSPPCRSLKIGISDASTALPDEHAQAVPLRTL